MVSFSDFQVLSILPSMLTFAAKFLSSLFILQECNTLLRMPFCKNVILN